MMVFLLLLILAVLLFGAGVFLKLGMAAIRVAVLLVVIALIFGLIERVPMTALGLAILVIFAAAGGGLYVIVMRSSDDDRLLASERGLALRAQGYTAQQTVDILRSGAIVPEPPKPADTPLPAAVPVEHAHKPRAAAAAPVGPRRLIQDNLLLPARIEYLDAQGDVSTRTVEFHSAYGHNGIVDRLDGWCSGRRAERSFMIHGILSLIDLETDEEWTDAAEWFEARRYEDEEDLDYVE